MVTPYTGNVPKRTAVHQTAGNGQAAHKPEASLPPVEIEELIQQVAEILERDPLRPIEVEAVSSEDFRRLIRADLEATYPDESLNARVQAFSLLRMIPGDFDWIGSLVEIQLAKRSAVCEQSGDRIQILKSVDPNYLYVRLDLMGVIVADAIFRPAPKERKAKWVNGRVTICGVPMKHCKVASARW